MKKLSLYVSLLFVGFISTAFAEIKTSDIKSKYFCEFTDMPGEVMEQIDIQKRSDKIIFVTRWEKYEWLSKKEKIEMMRLAKLGEEQFEWEGQTLQSRKLEWYDGVMDTGHELWRFLDSKYTFYVDHLILIYTRHHISKKDFKKLNNLINKTNKKKFWEGNEAKHIELEIKLYEAFSNINKTNKTNKMYSFVDGTYYCKAAETVE